MRHPWPENLHARGAVRALRAWLETGSFPDETSVEEMEAISSGRCRRVMNIIGAFTDEQARAFVKDVINGGLEFGVESIDLPDGPALGTDKVLYYVSCGDSYDTTLCRIEESGSTCGSWFFSSWGDQMHAAEARRTGLTGETACPNCGHWFDQKLLEECPDCGHPVED